MTVPSRRERVTHNTELGAGAVAGTSGSAFGAAKLRDLHAEQYPKAHESALGHAARNAGPKVVTKLRVGRPGFKTAAVGTAAAATATGAKRYEGHLKRNRAIAKADELKRLPRYVIHDGCRKRVLGMHDKDNFKVLDRDDTTRIVHRSKVKFPVRQKSSVTKCAFGVTR